jgi:hypothetical protein
MPPDTPWTEIVESFVDTNNLGTTRVLRAFSPILRPGGRLLVLGHDADNVAHGVGGPQEPAILHSVERLAPVAELLAVDRLEQVQRVTPEGVALDTLLWGRRAA